MLPDQLKADPVAGDAMIKWILRIAGLTRLDAGITYHHRVMLRKQHGFLHRKVEKPHFDHAAAPPHLHCGMVSAAAVRMAIKPASAYAQRGSTVFFPY